MMMMMGVMMMIGAMMMIGVMMMIGAMMMSLFATFLYHSEPGPLPPLRPLGHGGDF